MILIVFGTAGSAGAHGVEIGGRTDPPVPFGYLAVGASAALVISFAAVGLLWKTPRLQHQQVRRLELPWFGHFARAAPVVGLGALLLVVVAGLAGSDRTTHNIAPVLVWIVFWLVVPFVGALVGDLWDLLNPFRTIGELGRIGTDERPERTAAIGIWPAAAAFGAFTWLELVYSEPGSPWVLAIAAIAYTVYVTMMMASYGRTAGLQTAEAFTAYNRLVSSIAPVGRADDRQVVWRGWLRALPALPQWPGLTAFVILMIGTVTYDGLSGTAWWTDTLVDLDLSPTSTWVGTLALAGTTATVGAGYWQACWIAAQIAEEDGHTANGVARSFAHTLVPIALAYAFAHYFTLIVFEGQFLFSTISDPLDRGWDLFGTADWTVNVWLSATAIWFIQVAAIVVGHIAAVVLAHDRALAEFRHHRAVRSQGAMLAVMVALTVFGLTILSAG